MSGFIMVTHYDGPHAQNDSEIINFDTVKKIRSADNNPNGKAILEFVDGTTMRCKETVDWFTNKLGVRV